MLNHRQEQLYTYTVDLYRPAPLDTMPNRNAKDKAFQLAYQGIRCYHMNTTQVASPGIPGRTLQDNLFTLDQFHFDAIQEIEDTWIVQITGPIGYAEVGSWYSVMGNPQVMIGGGRRHPNYAQVYVSKGTRPKLVTD